MRIHTLSAIALVAGLSGTLLWASGHADEQTIRNVEARQAHMGLMGYNLGVLGAMAKGAMDYDPDLAGASASNLSLLAQLHQPMAWMPGTDSQSFEGSRVKPALWESFPDVGKKLGQMKEKSAALSAVAATDLDTMRGALGELGAVCSACHEAYREPAS